MARGGAWVVLVVNGNDECRFWDCRLFTARMTDVGYTDLKHVDAMFVNAMPYYRLGYIICVCMRLLFPSAGNLVCAISQSYIAGTILSNHAQLPMVFDHYRLSLQLVIIKSY